MNLNEIDIRDSFFDQLYLNGSTNKNIIILSADMDAFSLRKFSKDFPDQYINVGVSEQNMINVASGLAMSGKIVYCYSIASFATLRCFEQIKVNICSMNLPVTIVGAGAGFSFGYDGPTHHGALDIAYLKCVQGIIVSAPKDGNELRHLLYTALDYTKGPFSIRYPKACSQNFDEKGQAELLPIGSWEVCRKSKGNTVILAVGAQVFDGINAAKNLSEQGIECEVVNCRFIKPMDEDYLQSTLERFDNVITIEEGVKTGGFGEGVAAWLATNGYKGSVKIISLPDEFVEHGPRDLLLEKWGVNQKGIEDIVLKQSESIKLQY